jgi:hypothetical protein
VVFAYCSPLSIFQLLNNRIIVVGVRLLDCISTDRREIKIGNKPGRFLRVSAEEDITDTDVSMIDPKLTKPVKTLGTSESLERDGGIA